MQKKEKQKQNRMNELRTNWGLVTPVLMIFFSASKSQILCFSMLNGTVPTGSGGGSSGGGAGSGAEPAGEFDEMEGMASAGADAADLMEQKALNFSKWLLVSHIAVICTPTIKVKL